MFNVSVFGTNDGIEVGTKRGVEVDGADEDGDDGGSDIRSGVGMNGAGLTGAGGGGGASVSGVSSTCLRLSSMRSVSTNPLKFCFDLSPCKLMTVISRSGIVSGSWPDPDPGSP